MTTKEETQGIPSTLIEFSKCCQGLRSIQGKGDYVKCRLTAPHYGLQNALEQAGLEIRWENVGRVDYVGLKGSTFERDVTPHDLAPPPLKE